MGQDCSLSSLVAPSGREANGTQVECTSSVGLYFIRERDRQRDRERKDKKRILHFQAPLALLAMSSWARPAPAKLTSATLQ